MQLRHRTPASPAASPLRTDHAEESHTLVPLVNPIATAWPIHARRCLTHLPERLRWAPPVLDPEPPGPGGRAGARRFPTPGIPASSTAPPTVPANYCCGCTTGPTTSCSSSAATRADPPDHPAEGSEEPPTYHSIREGASHGAHDPRCPPRRTRRP